MTINNLVPATIQAKLAVKCSCKYCKEKHLQTFNFKLQLEKSDTHNEFRVNKINYPHDHWIARYIFDGSFSLSEKPKSFHHKSLEEAMIGAVKELEFFIKNNQ